MNMEPDPNADVEERPFCPLCSIGVEGAMEVHIETKRHKYNYILQSYNENKKSKAKDRNGIEVGITAPPYEVIYSNANGTARTLLDIDANGVQYLFTVKNVSKKPILLVNACLLHPHGVFQLDYDISTIASPLLKGQSRSLTVSFKSSGIGYYDVPVCLNFHRSGDEFFIIKSMAIEVTQETVIIARDEVIEPSPFTGELWGTMNGIVPPAGRFEIEPLDYEIPKEYKRIFKYKLKTWSDITDWELQLLTDILTSFPFHKGYGEEFKKTSNFFFHVMLWMNEYFTCRNLRNYNMMNVPMRLAFQNKVELKVPGLAEKRPSVIKNDILLVRVRYGDNYELEAYEGRIADVLESSVLIADFHPNLLNRLHWAEEHRQPMMFDVRFTLNRYPMYCMHHALDKVLDDGNIDVIFPEEKEPMQSLLPNNNYPFYNKEVAKNVEQTVAVHNIVTGSSRPSPYIVFGPPGTGKTVTIVEAILQIKKLFRASFILVCAPSNSACDHIAQLLVSHCTPQELLRLNSKARDWDNVPKDIQVCTNRPSDKLDINELKKYRIIVSTLTGAARFAGEEEYHFTHVFIDEAGQALEPEALVAIGGILGTVSPKHPGGQLVLAGDPKQLGPVCFSLIAQKAGLSISLLERLMVNSPLYQRGMDGSFNVRYITKLLDNYRSHPDLLELPNKLFYDGELRAKCGPEVRNDPLHLSQVLKAQGPLIFHGVIGQDRREGKSPSYFNQLEIDAVVMYMKALLGPNFHPTIKQSEIGVIAPYIRQVYKLKRSFEIHKWNDVEVGTTETFQGREKRVILISTVRANRNLLDYDRNFQLGFLVDKKRFNVAVTRARSMLIVIGCPHILEMDSRWRALIGQSKTVVGSYQGCAYNLRSDQWTDEVIKRVHGPSGVEKAEKKK